MAITWGQYKTRIAHRAHKTLTRALDLADVEHWAKAGIEYMEGDDALQHLEVASTLTLVAEQHNYAFPEPILTSQRFDVLSFNCGGRSSELKYARTARHLDAIYGPNWRLSTGTPGTPRYFVDFGNEFWIAPKPSATFVASNPTVYFYGQSSDLYTIAQIDTSASQTVQDATALAIPPILAEAWVVAALYAGLQQEDDPDWRAFERAMEKEMVRVRGFNRAKTESEPVDRPSFALAMRF